ncbi:MAG: hypothetical protein CVU34_18795 [Betaproteobacteria bacterium HGW-Betaproteobacteria-7]|jgi:hypothetical protein|nr:MAG: hypothetical protein CVU34_18795 [Betaproteobacteria bacterium HGW-Betaproteobacteria-7]
MRLRHLLLPLLAVPLLAACVNDGATYEIDNTREHVLSVIREQPYFWDSKVDLFLVVSRMPVCLRRHSLGTGTDKTRVEVWQVPSGAFIVRVGKRLYATETQTCEGFAKLDAEPVEGMGELRGIFRVRQGEWRFVKEAAPGAEDAEE